MIHTIRLIQRRLEGKSNPGFLPFTLVSLLTLATGLLLLFNNN